MSDKRNAADSGQGRPSPSLLQTFRTIGWAFFGVRRRAGHDHDMQTLKPHHLIIAGLVAAAVFVLAVMLLVRWVVSSGVAA